MYTNMALASTAHSNRGSKKVKTGTQEDRISSLPDSVLVHILSFLPAKCVFGTSILSSRWKNIWTSVPILIIHEDTKYIRQKVRSSYMDFVDRLLLLRDQSSIQKFSLQFREGIDVSRLNAWIRHVMNCNIQELDISMFSSFFTTNHLQLPLDLFTCKTLVVLKLSPYLLFNVPSSIYLPNLKIFHVSLSFPNNDLTQKLFCGCPVLEELQIGGYPMNYEEILINISAPALKKLEFVWFIDDSTYFESSIIIDTPVLEHLTISDDFLAHYTLSNVSSLVKAVVDVGVCSIKTLGGPIKQANRACRIVKEISKVKLLNIGAATMAALNYAEAFEWPMFPNLTRLEIDFFNYYGWELLPNLFYSVPNLAILILKKEKEDDDCDDDVDEINWVESQERPACLVSQLKEITLIGFKGLKNEMELIKYLLENAQVLKKVSISSSDSSTEEESEFFKKILLLPRTSRTSGIEFAQVVIPVVQD